MEAETRKKVEGDRLLTMNIEGNQQWNAMQVTSRRQKKQ
jgi:hypothetical protein